MLHAVTNQTAAELIMSRSDPDRPNMGLTTWADARRSQRIRKSDVGVAKNYLGEKEIGELNIIVGMFLDAAELRARRRQTIRLAEWETILDEFLVTNELPLLVDAGNVSAGRARQVAYERYAEFDAKRKRSERQESERADDIEELERIAEGSERRISLKRKSKR